MATQKKIRGYAILPANDVPRLLVTSGDRLPRARTIRAQPGTNLTDREGRLFAQAVKDHEPGVYRATFQPARLGQAPEVKVYAKAVKLSDEIAFLDKQAKTFSSARSKRVRMTPVQAESLRLAGIRSRALADGLRTYLGRAVLPEPTPAAALAASPRAVGYPVYRVTPGGAPEYLTTVPTLEDVATTLKSHGLEAQIGNVYAMNTHLGLRLTLAPETR
jgi:hypothetical protein